MVPGVNASVVQAIRTWASNEPLIQRVYIFGSRVKGTHRDDSDLDLAVITAGNDEGERLGNAIFEMARWTSKLQRLLPIKLDLQCAMTNDIVVMPAVRDHGVLIYQARNAEQI